MTPQEVPWDYYIERSHYAYFSAKGATDPSIFTQQLNISPDQIYRQGDVWNTPNGQSHKRRQSLWRLNSELEANVSLDSHVNIILQRLYPHRDALV